jgi:lactocepin
MAVSDNVLSQIKSAIGVAPKRLAGRTSALTSAELAKAGKGRWGNTAIITTNKSFKDALSVAPVSYAKHWPILLADNGKSLSKDVVNTIKSLGIKRAYIVGGELAVTKNVESQLKTAGITFAGRLAGKNGIETSKLIADFALKNGLQVTNMAFATSMNYPDALAGAALCGKNKSVLLLCDEAHQENISFAKANKAKLQTCYIFGGEFAFPYYLACELP